MLIRSQDKKTLYDITGNHLRIMQTWGKDGGWTIDCNGWNVAEYTSEEKALKVLDQIQKYMISNTYVMPADNEAVLN